MVPQFPQPLTNRKAAPFFWKWGCHSRIGRETLTGRKHIYSQGCADAKPVQGIGSESKKYTSRVKNIIVFLQLQDSEPRGKRMSESFRRPLIRSPTRSSRRSCPRSSTIRCPSRPDTSRRNPSLAAPRPTAQPRTSLSARLRQTTPRDTQER